MNASCQQTRLRFLLSTPLMYGASESGVEFDGNLPRYIRITDIRPDGTLDPDKAVSLPPDKAKPYLLNDLDVLLARSGATVGKAFLYRSNAGEACFAGYLIRARCDQRRMLPEYLSYYLQSAGYWNFINRSALQVTIQNVSAELYKEISVTHPSVEQQKKVVAYLDEQTTKIDRLMEMRRRQMALLMEQRAVLLQQAVTRGLNHKAQTKDSDLSWLGQIPKHWAVAKLKRVCFYQEGPGLRHWQFTDAGVRVICVTNITKQGITFDDYQRWISIEEYQRTYKHFTVQRGDLLLASSGNSWGKVAEYDSDESVILNTSTMRLNASRFGRITKDFLRLLLTADYLNTQLLVLLTGSCQPNFGPSHLDRLIVAFPPTIEEQQNIIAIYQRKSGQIDSLLSAYDRQLSLLAEYRAALIHECVTGQRPVPEVANA